MTVWAVRGVELPFGEEIASWWIDASGSIHDRPVAGADLLPGGFILPGLVDAHAHPAVGSGPAGLVALDEGAARATLIAWAKAGVTFVRDVGSRGGVILEHGFGLDERAIRDMAGRGTAWTPTLGALLALLDAPDITPGRRRRLREGLARVTELLPLAARLGVPVLAGTDVTGSIPGEVALLAQMGLEPQDALAAASTWPRRFLGVAAAADIVTYHHDPREDPGQLAYPAAVVAGGTRLR